jgi:hypothetical protein
MFLGWLNVGQYSVTYGMGVGVRSRGSCWQLMLEYVDERQRLPARFMLELECGANGEIGW